MKKKFSGIIIKRNEQIMVHAKLKSILLSIVSFFAASLPVYAQVKDIDGKSYKTCVIGKYKLMAENLAVERFRNGDKIPQAKTTEEWMEAGKNGTPAWCYYNNDPENGKKYGKLYNMHVFEDSRNIAPEGWKIIEYSTWDSLKKIVKWSGFWTKMKSKSDWKIKEEHKEGTNETGFNIMPAGYRSGNDGAFASLGVFTYFWRGMPYGGTATEAIGISNANAEGVFYSQKIPTDFPLGVSIRCEKIGEFDDPFKTFSFEESQVLFNDLYKPEMKIGDQVWSTENLNTDRFRNGDLITEAATAEEWSRAAKNGQPAWCYYPDKRRFGKLYNWYAVNDPRGIAPEGWHVPSGKEVEKLVEFLGGKEEAAKKMKSSASWGKQDGNTNSSGFNALPGGIRTGDGQFLNASFAGHYWTATLSKDKIRPVIKYHMSVGPVSYYLAFFGEGCSVRCLKD